MDTDQIQGTVEEASVVSQPEGEGQPLPEAIPTSEPKPTESIVPEAADLSDDLPDGASERTKRNFEKLREENRKLKERLSPKPDFGSSVFDTFRPPAGAAYPPQGPIAPTQFVDPEGNVDINGLNQTLLTANQRAQEAERRAAEASERVARFEETQQVREAHHDFPQLDPHGSNFDPDFFELVRDRVLRNMYENKPQTLLEVAQQLSSKYAAPQPVNVAKVKEDAVADYKATQELRNQGPIDNGRGDPRQTIATTEELRKQTRSSNKDEADAALTERMRNVGLIK